jgi:hypothetical protein
MDEALRKMLDAIVSDLDEASKNLRESHFKAKLLMSEHTTLIRAVNEFLQGDITEEHLNGVLMTMKWGHDSYS